MFWIKLKCCRSVSGLDYCIIFNYSPFPLLLRHKYCCHFCVCPSESFYLTFIYAGRSVGNILVCLFFHKWYHIIHTVQQRASLTQQYLLQICNHVLLTKLSHFRPERHRFDPWSGKIPWSRKWQPAPVFLPGKSHAQRSCMGSQNQTERRSMHTRCSLDDIPPLGNSSSLLEADTFPFFTIKNSAARASLCAHVCSPE